MKRLLRVCTEQGDGSLYALGIAFDGRRLDLVQEILNSPRALALPPTDRNSKFQLLLVNSTEGGGEESSGSRRNS